MISSITQVYGWRSLFLEEKMRKNNKSEKDLFEICQFKNTNLLLQINWPFDKSNEHAK